MKRGLLSLVVLLGLLAAPLGAEESSEATQLRQRLSEIMLNVDVENGTFEQVVKQLCVQSGLNIMIDPRVASDVAESVVTGLVGHNMSLETVLNLLVQAAGEEAIWVVRGNVVLITTRELVRDRMDVRIYPVRALVFARREFWPPPTGLVGHAGHEADEDIERHPLGTIDEVIELIMGAVSPRYWEETEGASIHTMDPASLVVRASAGIHAGIDRFLAHLDELTASAFLVEVHAIQPTSTPSRSASSVSKEAAAELLASPAAGPALRLAIREGLPSTAFVGERSAYVSGYDAHASGPTTLLNPRVKKLEGGMAVWVKAMAGGATQQILLKLEVAVADVVSSGRLGQRPHAALGLPERRVVRRNLTTLVTPGVWHWTEGTVGGAADAGWAFLVRVTPFPGATGGATQVSGYVIPSVQEGVTAAHPLADVRIADVQWEDTNLDQVAAYVRAMTGMNVYITPRVRAEVFDDVRLNLRMKDQAVTTLLDLVTEPFELDWRVTGNRITIHSRLHDTPPMALRYFDARDPMVLRYFDARDLARTYAPNGLADLVRETVGREELWEDPASIEARSGYLVVRNTRPVLDAVERMLDGLRESRTLVVTTIDQIRMGDGLAREFLRDESGHARLFLEPGAIDAIDAAAREGRATRISSERLVSLDRARARRSTGSEKAYVADHVVEWAGGEEGRYVKLPRVRIARGGTRLDVRTLAGHTGDYVYAEVVAEYVKPTRLETATTHGTTIQLPVADVWSTATGLRIPLDRTAVIMASSDEDGWYVLLATPTRTR